MSVINKMLRDLDRRQADQAAAQTQAQAQGQQSLHKGTQSLGMDARQGVGLALSSAARWWGAALLLLLLLGAYVLWSGSRLESQSAPAGSTGVVVTAMAPTLVPSLAPAMASASASASAAASAPAATAAPEVQAKPRQASAPVLAVPVGPAVRSTFVSKPGSPVKKEQPPKSVVASTLPAQPQAAPPPAPAPVVLPPLPQASASAQPPVQPPAPPTPLPGTRVKSRSQLAMEALAQAQAQWADGDQAGALQVVQGVIARLKKSPADDTLALAAAAREYVRMTTAQQRPADALAMLVQLEAPLAQVADIWALRGNTAQRLGLHAQAVHAYLNALELQPGQARWLLAAAVSMAAQGQTVPATELAEQARRAGFLPPDVANYLQQLGVVLRKP